jgi:hypothetical protein
MGIFSSSPNSDEPSSDDDISSPHPYGSIVIKTDQSFYYSGQMVTGNVYCDITQPFLCSSLNLKVKGQEKCKWSEK